MYDLIPDYLLVQSRSGTRPIIFNYFKDIPFNNISPLPINHPALSEYCPDEWPWQLYGEWSRELPPLPLPPDSNTGGKSSELSDTKTAEICITDWFSISFREDALMPGCVSDDDIAQLISQMFRQLGLAPDFASPGPGKNFYRVSYPLLSSQEGRGKNLGFLAVGGNSDTVNLNITGEGCSLIDAEGWKFLYHWCKGVDATITRLDVAYDDYDGKTTVEDCVEMWKSGDFITSGRPPRLQQHGNWVERDGRGRTAYVGARQSGKQLRCYEKGCQLGQADSEWVRWEIEFRNKDRVIPLEAILHPTQYFAGAYTALACLVDSIPKKISIVKKKLEIAYTAIVEHCRIQYGRLINVQRDAGMTNDEIIDLLVRPGVPGRLKIPIAIGDPHDYQDYCY